MPVTKVLLGLRKLPFIRAVTLSPFEITGDAGVYHAAGYDVGAFIHTLEDARAAIATRLEYVIIGDEPNAYGVTPAQYLESARPIADYLRSNGFTGIISTAGLAEEYTGFLGMPVPAEAYLRELVRLERGTVFDAFACNPFQCGHDAWRAVFNRVAPGRLAMCAGWSFQSHGRGWHWFAGLNGKLLGWLREFRGARDWPELRYSGIWCLPLGGALWREEYGLTDTEGELTMLGRDALSAAKLVLEQT